MLYQFLLLVRLLLLFQLFLLQLFYKEEVQDSKVRIIEHLIHRDLKDKKSCGEWFNISPQDAISHLQFAKIRYDSDDDLEFYWKNGLRII